MVKRIAEWLVFCVILFIMFFFGAAYGQTVKPCVATQAEPKYIVEEVPLIQEVYPAEFHQFASQDELSQWQADQYPALQELGKQNNWVCVDYALEMQRRAWLEGYQMSVENLIDKGGQTGHAICSTWIGDDCIYLEPQSTTSWVGAVKGNGAVGLAYTPILVYPETGEAVYREE